MAFDVAERVGQVRAMKAKIKAMEEEFEATLKPFEQWVETAEGELLQYLNDTKQKSAATANGTAYWSERTTFRVQDKEAFKDFIIDKQMWELATFGAAPTACEAFTQEQGGVPPGVTRHSERKVHVIAPSKPRLKKAAGNGAAPPDPEAELLTSGL